MSDYIPEINLNQYNYDLPQSLIAEFPLEDRTHSNLLVVSKSRQEIKHHKFYEISGFLPEKSMLVINSTKVIAARMKMRKMTGGKAEVLCVEPLSSSNDPQIAMNAGTGCRWKCIIGGRRINKGQVLESEKEKNGRLSAHVISKEANEAEVEFSWEGEYKFADIINKFGLTPLPPYIHREATEKDIETYQTVYAKSEGSVAAPTAGLHFSDEIFKELSKKKIDKAELILHVGPGTFKPIDTYDISSHEMHSEQIFITSNFLEKLKDHINSNDKFIIATGTTSVRTLESLYWYGVRLFLDDNNCKNDRFFSLGQWDPYRLKDSAIPLSESIDNIIKWMKEKEMNILSGRTSLFIIPGYDFRVIDAMITNFHMPRSTLILLVAAFLGRGLWKKAYDEALAGDYRFLSYGDSSLLLP